MRQLSLFVEPEVLEDGQEYVHVECACGYWWDIALPDLLEVQTEGEIECECGAKVNVIGFLLYAWGA